MDFANNLGSSAKLNGEDAGDQLTLSMGADRGSIEPNNREPHETHSAWDDLLHRWSSWSGICADGCEQR
jgi:hypothetical protein